MKLFDKTGEVEVRQRIPVDNHNEAYVYINRGELVCIVCGATNLYPKMVFLRRLAGVGDNYYFCGHDVLGTCMELFRLNPLAYTDVQK